MRNDVHISILCKGVRVKFPQFFSPICFVYQGTIITQSPPFFTFVIIKRTEKFKVRWVIYKTDVFFPSQLNGFVIDKGKPLTEIGGVKW